VTVEFLGYRRSDGRAATRNHVLVVPASPQANRICERVQEACPDAVCVTHQASPARDGLSLRTLAGVIDHPNVRRAVVVATSDADASWLALRERLAQPVELVTIAGAGGVVAAVDEAVRHCEDALELCAGEQRQPIPAAELVLATECGGSDANSGLSANPALGRCADRLVAEGGQVILAELTELIGAEHELAERAADPEVGRRLVAAVGEWERFAHTFGEDLTGANPCHGNIVGGISTIEEKSLGCVRKSGHSPLQDVVGFAERSPARGLVVMDTSGDDVEQLVAMTAGGATVIVFTTGRGTPAASPTVPTLKVSSTSTMADRLTEMVDFDAGGILDGTHTIQEAGDLLFALTLDAASGRATRAELLGQRDFALPVTMAGV
jgi:altronate dehydratase large subunit